LPVRLQRLPELPGTSELQSLWHRLYQNERLNAAFMQLEAADH
jgi:hypothetical protein